MQTSKPSSTRTPSPDAGWHDDELSDEARRQQWDGHSDKEHRQAREEYGESIGMVSGRTGVKGVIRDRNESEKINREKMIHEVERIRREMEKSSLGGKTFLEEERGKGLDEEVDEIVLRERMNDAEELRKDIFGRPREGRFGHLREVGAKGFLNGVEKEERSIWVVVHLYDPSLERCYLVDGTLARLARIYPDTKFLRAKAVTLGFALKSSNRSTQLRLPQVDDEDDSDDPEEDSGDIDEDVDLDVLPTILVYRGGELVHNWVRVDWEAGEAGIEELLDQHHILPRPESILGTSNLGFSTNSEDDDDFDLLLNDDDDDDDFDL